MILKNPPVSRAIQDAFLGPLESGGRQATITRRLQQAIELGFLEDGTQLPSESDLAAQLSVSTVTLRIALADLRSMGLLETRRGRGGGNFVRRPKQRLQTQPVQHLKEFSLDDLRDLRDHSTVIGGGIAQLAAERVRGSTIDHLHGAALAVKTSATPPEAARADLWFHMEVAAATRSAKLTKAELEIQTTVAPLLWLPGAETQTQDTAASDHRELVDAIAALDGTAARQIAERHISTALNQLIQFRMELLDDDATDRKTERG
ncbi:MAG: FadR family transcriptional regulator [Proteobacteria bacterium]|nr:FadR family transcriptional regulator [Pseudomonadota bacterium]